MKEINALQFFWQNLALPAIIALQVRNSIVYGLHGFANTVCFISIFILTSCWLYSFITDFVILRSRSINLIVKTNIIDE